MEYIQDTDWYKEGYLRKGFINHESLHYHFHFEPSSLAHQDIRYIINLKESHYNKINQWLGINNNQKIDYYLYPSLKDKISLMGDDSPGNAIWGKLSVINGEFISQKYEIHVIYNERCKFIGEHEDTHLLSLPWGLSVYLFCEGLAQYMENGFMGSDLHVLTKDIKLKGNLYSLQFLCSNDNWKDVELVIIYPQVGSFVKWLISEYSREKFKDVYCHTSRHYSLSQNLDEIKKVYGKDILVLESEWLLYLNKMVK